MRDGDGRIGGFIGALAAAGLLVATLGAQQPPTASIRGVVTDPDGARLPGVTIRAEGEGIERRVYSEADGTYEFDRLMPGDYAVIATLPGLCTQGRSSVRVGPRTATVVDFAMSLMMVDYRPGHGIAFPPPEAVAYADAVLRMRVSGIDQAELMSGDRYCGGAGVAYEADVIGAVKRHDVHGPTGPRVRFVQYPVGRWVDGEFERYPVDLYEDGDELVVFLMWDERLQRFVPLSERYVVPVHRGTISWQLQETHGIRDGMPVEDFLEVLAALLRNGG